MSDPLTAYFLCETYTGYRDFFMRVSPAPQGLPPLYQTWDGWAERGHRVHVFTQDYMHDGYSDWTHGGKQMHNIPVPFRYLRDHRFTTAGKTLYRFARLVGLARLWRRMIHIAAQDPPDVVYSCSPWCTIPAWRLSKRLNAVHIVRRFGTVLYEQMRGKSFGLQDSLYIEAAGYRLPFDLLVMGNDGTYGDRVALHYGCPPEKLRFWTNGINKQLYRPGFDRAAFRRRLGYPEDTPLILALSRLTRWKRLDRVLAAMQHVKAARPDARLLIVGPGEAGEDRRLEALARELGVDDVTRLVGAVGHEQIGDYLNGANVYIQLFDLTNRCNPLFEAMTCALPVVTTDDPSIDDTVEHGKTALRVSADDTARAGQCLLELLADPQRRQALGTAAREHILQNFQTWPERIEMEVQTVLELLGAKGRSHSRSRRRPAAAQNANRNRADRGVDDGAVRGLRRSERELVVGTCMNALSHREGRWYIHHSFGTIVERVAPRVKQVIYRGPLLSGPRADKFDFELRHANIVIRPMGTWHNTLTALKRPLHLLFHYWELVRACDVLFIRGTGPLSWAMHWMAWPRGMRVVQWIAANPVQILAAERRGYGWLLERLGLVFAYFERMMTRLSAKVSRAYLVTSGGEIARLYPSSRTIMCESASSTSEADFLVREDTCTGAQIRILFLGFIRAEKGIEYLLRAVPLIESDRQVVVALVGGWDQFPTERERLLKIIAELGIEHQVSWEGYARYGAQLFSQIDCSDMLVVPSLSEGAPRVLIEARARSLPVVASRVGGIPSSITDGVDGLLVPPRDPAAIARAVSRIIGEPELRRQLIRYGRERVSKLTIEWFVDLIMDLLTRSEH